MLLDPLPPDSLGNLSVLTLASMGDCFFDLLVRARLCAGGAAGARQLHRRRVALVNAGAQAAAARRILPLLTDEEAHIFRRGRNAHPGTLPKTATREEYQMATALEALLGWLCLSGQNERLRALFEVLMHEAETQK